MTKILQISHCKSSRLIMAAFFAFRCNIFSFCFVVKQAGLRRWEGGLQEEECAILLKSRPASVVYLYYKRVKVRQQRPKAVGARGQGCLGLPYFGRSVNPIPTRVADYAHQIYTCPPPRFSNLPTPTKAKP